MQCNPSARFQLYNTVYVYQLYLFLQICMPHSAGRGSFFALSAAGHAGGRVYTRRKSGPRSSSVARALGVQSCAIWQVITGSLSECSLLCRAARTSPGRLATSHVGRPSVQQQSRFKLVSSCYGAFVCLPVCDRGWQIETSRKQRCYCFGNTAVHPFTEG